jgi:hypothetical protein
LVRRLARIVGVGVETADMLAKGIAVDLITDHDVDREGVALLKPYRAVVTGSHPEYHTPNTLNAQDEKRGGDTPSNPRRLMTNPCNKVPRRRKRLKLERRQKPEHGRGCSQSGRDV